MIVKADKLAKYIFHALFHEGYKMQVVYDSYYYLESDDYNCEFIFNVDNMEFIIVIDSIESWQHFSGGWMMKYSHDGLTKSDYYILIDDKTKKIVDTPPLIVSPQWYDDARTELWTKVDYEYEDPNTGVTEIIIKRDGSWRYVEPEYEEDYYDE